MNIEQEIANDQAHYKQALRKIMLKHEETGGAFLNGYFAVVAKEYHVKVRPLKALYEMAKKCDEARKRKVEE